MQTTLRFNEYIVREYIWNRDPEAMKSRLMQAIKKDTEGQGYSDVQVEITKVERLGDQVKVFLESRGKMQTCL